MGGDNYSKNNKWNYISNYNINSIVDLVNDIDADGVDIDYEGDPKCNDQAVKITDKDNIRWKSDEINMNYIVSLRQKLRPHLLITSAVSGINARQQSFHNH